MAKRDYKSYNILGDELEKEVNMQPCNQKKDKTENTSHLNSLEEIDVLHKDNGISKQSIDMSTNRMTLETYRDKIEEVRLIESNDSSDINNEFERIVDNDTSFSTYKDNYQKKERNRVVKWAVRLSKFIIILMLLPFIGVIGSVVLTFFGFFITGIVGAFSLGIALIGITSFFATQISALLIALGIASSITALSFGMVLTILFLMMVKQVKSLLQKYRKPKRTRTIQEGK